MLGKRGEKVYERLAHYMEHELGMAIKQLTEASTSEIEVDDELREIHDAHTLERAYGKSLDYVVANIGLKRLPGEDDYWLRERAKLWIFIHGSSSTAAEIRKAVAWYIGIRRKNSAWESEIFPQVKVYLNESPHWPYAEVDGVGRNLPGYAEVSVPWKHLDLWAGDGWCVGSVNGAFPWQAGDPDSVLHGHHLALEILELLDILAPAGMKLRLWAEGWSVGSKDGDFPWQTNADEDRISGYVEFRGEERYIKTYADEPEGNLRQSVDGMLEHLPPGLLWRPLRARGDRVFSYGIDMRDGGTIWP